VSLAPYPKDGGVFVQFTYHAHDSDHALKSIMTELREGAVRLGGFPSWSGLGGGNAWLVKGTPWREVRPSPPSTILSVPYLQS
jgi:hypothetical protein